MFPRPCTAQLSMNFASRPLYLFFCYLSLCLLEVSIGIRRCLSSSANGSISYHSFLYYINCDSRYDEYVDLFVDVRRRVEIKVTLMSLLLLFLYFYDCFRNKTSSFYACSIGCF